MTDETDLGAFEMLWDCPACGTAKLLGKSQRFCPSCGAAQDPKTRYFPSDEDKIAVRDHEFFGADVVCPACDVPNSKNAAHCVACGADLAKGKEASIRGEQAVASGAAFGKETAKDAKTEHKNARLAREAAMQGKPPPNAPPPAKKFYQSKGFLIGAGIVFALVCTLLVLLFWKKEATVIVTGHQWKRVVGVEKFAPKNESAWCDSVPGDAYALSRKSEVRSQKKIADGKTCKTVRKDRGDGTFKETEKCETKYREEPVYDNKCYFQVNRWQLDRSLDASGTSLAQSPVWPDVSTLRLGACMGCERELSRKETYTLQVKTSDNKTDACEFDQAIWASMPVGTAKKAKVRMMGGGVDCASLAAAR